MALLVAGCVSDVFQVDVDVPPRRAPVGIETLGIQPFGEGDLGLVATQQIEARLLSEGYVKPVTGQGPYTLSGDIHLDGVHLSHHTTETQREVKIDGGKVYMEPVVEHHVRKRARAVLTYRLAHGGEVVTAASHSKSFDKEYSGSTYDEAMADARSDSQIARGLVKKLAKRVVKDISPHRVTRELVLERGDHPGLKQGITYMQNGRPEQAMGIWTQVTHSAASVEDIAAAFYNIGIIREAMGDYEDAFVMFSEADARMPATERYIKAMTRAEKSQVAEQVLGSRQ